MSALGGVVRMPPPEEIATGGSVVLLHDEPPPAERVQTSGSQPSDHGPISPELALIDPSSGAQRGSSYLIHIVPSGWLEHLPGLSAEARVLSRFRSAPARSPNPHLGAAFDSAWSRLPRRSSRSARCSRWSSGARSQPSSNALEQTQSVAAAVAPTGRLRSTQPEPAPRPTPAKPVGAAATTPATSKHRPTRARVRGQTFALGHPSADAAGIRVPAVPGRRARLPRARGRRPARTSGSLAAGGTPVRTCCRGGTAGSCGPSPKGTTQPVDRGRPSSATLVVKRAAELIGFAQPDLRRSRQLLTVQLGAIQSSSRTVANADSVTYGEIQGSELRCAATTHRQGGSNGRGVHVQFIEEAAWRNDRRRRRCRSCRGRQARRSRRRLWPSPSRRGTRRQSTRLGRRRRLVAGMLRPAQRERVSFPPE